MANNGTNQEKVEVNGDTPTLNPTRKNQITMALARNGGMKRIEAKMRQGLDETGWSQTLKEYITALFRSGEATTYDDALAIVMSHILEGETPPVEARVPAPDLTIPKLARDDGVGQIKKELNQILVEKKYSIKRSKLSAKDHAAGKNGVRSIDQGFTGAPDNDNANVNITTGSNGNNNGNIDDTETTARDSNADGYVTDDYVTDEYGIDDSVDNDYGDTWDDGTGKQDEDLGGIDTEINSLEYNGAGGTDAGDNDRDRKRIMTVEEQFSDIQSMARQTPRAGRSFRKGMTKSYHTQL